MSLDTTTGDPALPDRVIELPPTPLLSGVGQERQVLAEQVLEHYRRLPEVLRDPESQDTCMNLLGEAERLLAKEDLTWEDISAARQAVTRVAIHFARLDSSRFSFSVVVALVYFGILVGAVLGYLGYRGGWFGADAVDMSFMEVPLPVWLWAVIGSFTSMLFRAGHLPFNDRAEALRWLFFRPIVGVVMGVLAYLLLIAGLVVFTGGPETQTAELVWVIAFVGAFSDSLSVNLLQRLVGNISMDRTVAMAQEGVDGAPRQVTA